MLLMAPAVFPAATPANVVTIRKAVRQIVGDNQTRNDARAGALAQAKREALEQAGTYLEVLTVVKNARLEKDEIIALASGILRSRIVREKPFVDGSAMGIQVVEWSLPCPQLGLACRWSGNWLCESAPSPRCYLLLLRWC